MTSSFVLREAEKVTKILLIAWFVLAAAAQVGNPSKEKELALGAALASEFRKHSTPVANPDVASRVEALVRRLAGADSGYSWHVEVVEDDLGGPTHEPTYFPGGYLFVPSALLTSAGEEAEVAAMLAHAMAHVTERHGFRPGPVGSIYMGAGPLMPVGALREQRKFEGEADRRAITMLAAAGFDATALKTYISRRQADPENGLFSRWPVREVRITAIDAALRDHQR